MARALAVNQAAEGLKRVQPVLRSHATDIYLNVAPNNVSVRDSYGRQNYEDFRTQERIPTKPKEIITACFNAYDNVGIVRNVIDLMTDFVTKGLDVHHPNERIEKFHKALWRKWQAYEVSGQMSTLLLLNAFALVKRQTAKLPAREEEALKRTKAEPDIEVDERMKLGRREIPWRYNFLNPCTVDLLSPELAPFIGGKEGFLYGIKVPDTLTRIIKSPSSAVERMMVAKLPKDIRQAITSGNKLLPLDPNKVVPLYYKRLDWQPWPKPMLYPILADLNILQKMKLADLSALDGAISCIRVWKLGNLEARIMPTPEIMMRLAEMLTNNVGGGVMDLVWGPDIELVETKTDVHHFLGATKYAPVLDFIYSGLGIPPTLTGSGQTQGFTNNYISLKTLVERLGYVRSIIREFWMNELQLVQQSMGFRFQASVVFDDLLTDEAAEKQMLLHLADRDYIDIESLQDRFGLDPDVVAARTRRDMRRRKEGQIPTKASPFHDPQHKEGIEKVFAQSGAYGPSQFDVELKEKKEGEVVPLELQAKLKPKPAAAPPGGKKKGQPGAGRPRNSKDKQKRKQKVVKPRTSAQLIQSIAIAEEQQAYISKMVAPAFLKSVGKKTMRELTDTESRNFEAFKFDLLCQFSLGQVPDGKTIAQLVQNPLKVPENVRELLRMTVARYAEQNGKEPPLEVLRRFQSSVFALYRGEFDADEETGDSDNAVS